MGIRADFEAVAVLPLVHVRIHVAHDRIADFLGRVREHRDRPDVDHLVDRRRERDRCAGHPGDPRAPDPAGDDDDLGFDRPGVGMHPPDLARFDVDAGDLNAGRDRQAAHLLCLLAHERTGLERVDDPDPRRVEATEDGGLLDERDHLLDLRGGEQAAALDAP